MSDSRSSSPPPLHKASPDYGYNNHGKSLPSSPPTSSRHSSSSKTPSSQSSRERPPTAKELMRMLVEEQETTRELQQQLTLTTSQLAFEQDRADAAERKLKETVIRFKDANDVRISSQADAARLREELKLYKKALEEAQKEIFKAQNILRDVEGRRREAEEEASKLRRKLRKMQEEKMVELAREEGRKQGLQEGIEMGKDIGYLQGRNQGYVNGRSTASKVMERYFSPPSESEIRSSRGEPDLPPESDPPYTATTMRYPSDDTSARTSSSFSSEQEALRYSRTGGTRTDSARATMYSPAQPHVEIPPDGFIPEADASMIIRLPPPHELIRPPPTPTGHSPSLRPDLLSPQVAPVSVPGDVPVLMVPEPRSPGNSLYDLPGERQHRKVGRRSSRESVSSSTRTSELDLLNAPEHVPIRSHRSSGLSVIPEVASLQEGSTASGRSMSQQGEDRVDEAGFVHVSMPAPLTAAEMASLKARSPQRLSVDQKGHSRPGSTSSFGTVNITIQPPSRPASNTSATTVSGTRSHLLSPADADRPVPLPYQTPPADATNGTIVMDLPDGELPPGFMPTGLPAPAGGAETSYTGAGVPLPPSTIGSYHSRLPSHGGSVWGEAETPVVIPPPSGRGGQESDESSSDADTLTTPPRRYQVPSSGGYSAAGVALPGSSVGGTPYSYVRSVGGEGMYHVHAGVTPAALGRTRSIGSTDRG